MLARPGLLQQPEKGCFKFVIDEEWIGRSPACLAIEQSASPIHRAPGAWCPRHATLAVQGARSLPQRPAFFDRSPPSTRSPCLQIQSAPRTHAAASPQRGPCLLMPPDLARGWEGPPARLRSGAPGPSRAAPPRSRSARPPAPEGEWSRFYRAPPRTLPEARLERANSV